MARSTLEILLDSMQDREEKPADDLPRLPQRPPSRGRLPSSRSGRLLTTLSCDRNVPSSASYSDGDRSSDPCPTAFTATVLINGVSDPCPSLAKDGLKRTVLRGNQAVMAQETLDQASIAEGKNGMDSPMKDLEMPDEPSAGDRNGSSDPSPSTATDESHPSDELKMAQAQLNEYRVMTTQESFGQTTMAKSNIMKKENGKSSSAQERTKEVAMAERDTLKVKCLFIFQNSLNIKKTECTLSDEIF